MKTCVIKQTGASHGSSGMAREIKYIGDETTKAHDLNVLPKSKRKLSIYKKRNLILGGVGVDTVDGYKATLNNFKKLAKKKPHNKVRTLNFVISPEKRTVDPNNYNQVSAFRNFCEDYVKKAFPNHLAYVAVQWDNWKRDNNGYLYGGIPHAHLIVSALSTLPPYNTMTGNEYHMTRLKHLYNQERLIFDKKQNIIHLGPSALWKDDSVTPKFTFANEIYQNTQDIMDNLEKGKYQNRTQLKRAFKNEDIIIKFHDFKHRKYQIVTQNNGKKRKKYVYRRYQTGPKKGQYMWRKSKHGRHKIPVYTHTYGVTFHHNKNMGQRKRQYAKGSDMLDNRFNYQHIMHCLNHASELRRKYELEDETKWKINQSVRKWGPEPSNFNLGSNSSVSVDPLSSAYAHSYSSAVTAISNNGTDLASITPRPLSSISYNSITDRALASAADVANSDSGLTNSISSLEDTFNEPGNAIASGATTENGLHEEYKVDNFMPKLSTNKIRQGAYMSIRDIYPEYLVDKGTGKSDNNVLFHDLEFNHHDIFLMNGLFNHISSFVKQTAKSADERFVKMYHILHKKAKGMKKWLDRRVGNLMPTKTGYAVFLKLHDVFVENDKVCRNQTLSKRDNLRSKVYVAYHQNVHKNILVNIKEAHTQIVNRINNIRVRWRQRKRKVEEKRQEQKAESKATSYYNTPEGKYTLASMSYRNSIKQSFAAMAKHRNFHGPTLE